jgi:hypothetical protein
MIDEHEVAGLLRAAVDDVAVPVVPARELAAAGGRRRRRRRVLAGAAAATAVAAVTAGVLGPPWPRPDATTATPSAAGASCVDPVPSRVLPGWARAGFTDPDPRIPYVLGDDGHIAAILFVQPLTAPPSVDHTNKILWVSRVGTGPLRITATLADGSTTATRVVAGGPGPSTIDLPEPGCWHLTLRWGGRTDTLDLAYAAP